MNKYSIKDTKSENIVNLKGLREYCINNDLCIDTVYCGCIGIDSFSIKKFNKLVRQLNNGTRYIFCEKQIYGKGKR